LHHRVGGDPREFEQCAIAELSATDAVVLELANVEPASTGLASMVATSKVCAGAGTAM
jgi:hypothetical protein